MNDNYSNQSDQSTLQDDIQIADLSLSLSKKEQERNALRQQMEAYLSGGGAINHIAPNVLADPPKKPQSNYGGQPI